MLGYRTSVVATLALVASALVAASPADADVLRDWSFDVRPPGYPAAGAAPAETLTAASAHSSSGGRTAAFEATIELAAVPDDADAARLQLAIGTVQDGACVAGWTLTVPTFDPQGPASRDGRTITIRTGAADDLGDPPCGSVSVLAADGTTLDRLEEPAGSQAIADPAGSVRITGVDAPPVVPGRWSRVWLRVVYAGAPADGIRVDPRAHGVATRRVRVTQDIEDGDRLWIAVPVRLRGDEPRRLQVRVSPFGHLFVAYDDRRTIRIRPAR